MTDTLTNNTGTLTFEDDQKNTFTLKTADRYVNSDIVLTTKVTKAVLNTAPGDTDHKSFQIQVPNGNSNVTFTFAVDNQGNVTVS